MNNISNLNEKMPIIRITKSTSKSRRPGPVSYRAFYIDRGHLYCIESEDDSYRVINPLKLYADLKEV